MKTYISFTALAVLITVAGCGPRLAETPLGSEEKRWEGYIKQSYPAWKAPQTVPPTDAKAKVDGGNVVKTDDNMKVVTDDIKVTDDVVVTTPKGKVLEDTQEKIDIQEKFQTYVVQKNDTLWKIAKKVYGRGSQWKKIQAANGDVLKGSSKLRPGMTLRIPAL